MKQKRNFTNARTQALTPFETLFTKKSCLDYLKEANEYLYDEETRVKKTPAGFFRPKKNQTQDRSVVLSRHRRQRAALAENNNE